MNPPPPQNNSPKYNNVDDIIEHLEQQHHAKHQYTSILSNFLIFSINNFQYGVSNNSDNSISILNNTIQKYYNDVSRKNDSSIILTGISGSGKSHNRKIIIQRLLRDTKFSALGIPISFILECFGNCSISSNPISNRFGIRYSLLYSKQSYLTAIQIQTYFFEKNRILWNNQTDNTNFMIINQLIASLKFQKYYSIILVQGYLRAMVTQNTTIPTEIEILIFEYGKNKPYNTYKIHQDLLDEYSNKIDSQ
eukprot:162445_1